MRLRRIEIARLPGIDRPYTLADLSAGVNVVFGPNASGKSSLCRAVRATFWPDASSADGVEVISLWDDAGGTLRAEAGRTVRWHRDGVEVSPPDLPDAHLAHCYTLVLRDLLDLDDKAGATLAHEVRVQMAGGYDLPAALGTFTTRARHGKQEEVALRSANQKRASVELEHRKLAAEEDALARLQRELEGARRTADEAAWLDRAERLARQRAALADHERMLGELPGALERMSGDDLQTFQEIEDALVSVDEACEAHRAEIAACERELREAALARGPVDEAALRIWRDRARALGRLEKARTDQVGDVRRAEAALVAASHGDEFEDDAAAPVTPDADLLDELDRWWSDSVDARERRRALEGRRSAVVTVRSEGTDAETLRRAADALREWLAAPLPPRTLGESACGALAGAGVGLALAAAWADWPWLWAPAGLAWAPTIWLLAARPWRLRDRDRARERFQTLGLSAPDSWERASTQSRLRSIDVDLAQAEQQRLRDAEADAAERELRQHAATEAELETRRHALVERLGLDPGTDGLHLVETARRILERRRAAADLARERATADSLEAEVSAALSAIREFCAEVDLGAPRDAAETETRLDDLVRRSAAVRDASRRSETASRNLGLRERDQRKIEARRRALLERLGLENEDPSSARRRVEELAKRWPEHREKVRHVTELRGAVDGIATELEKRPDLAELDSESLSARRVEAEAASARATELLEQIHDVRARASQARSSDALEQAIAAEGEAVGALRERREEALDAAAGRLLLEDVAAEHESESRPAVLARAMGWFEAFTHHRFQLRLDPGRADGDPRFRAIETAGERGLSLDELSDGTRTQLLLATRLAFATQAEHGSPVPIFLDEALTASDPLRFRAVAESLMALAREGRQIFYLTCNPADVAAWREVSREIGGPPPHEVDLAAIRKLQAAAAPDALRTPATPTVPAPGDASAEEYAARLGVPSPVPHAPAAALHLFHVLRDDLALLQRLLTLEIATVGQWRSWSRGGAAESVVDERSVRAVDARVEVAEAFLDAWRVGRGRPVERSILEQSGHVSEAFLDRLDDLAADLNRDAKRFCDALDAGDDERTLRFRAQNKSALRAALEEQGVLDPATPLDLTEVRARVVAALAPALEARRVDLDEVVRRVDELWSWLG